MGSLQHSPVPLAELGEAEGREGKEEREAEGKEWKGRAIP